MIKRYFRLEKLFIRSVRSAVGDRETRNCRRAHMNLFFDQEAVFIFAAIAFVEKFHFQELIDERKLSKELLQSL